MTFGGSIAGKHELACSCFAIYLLSFPFENLSASKLGLSGLLPNSCAGNMASPTYLSHSVFDTS